MNFILVTLPTILTTLWPPIPTQKINPKDFWRDTLLKIAPIAVLTGVAISVIYVGLILPFNAEFVNLETFRQLVAHFDRPLLEILPQNESQLRGILATVVICTAYFGFLIGILGEKLLNSRVTKNTWIRRMIYLAVTAAFTLIVFGVPFLRKFFEFNLPSHQKIWLVLGVVLVTSFLQICLMKKRKNQHSS